MINRIRIYAFILTIGLISCQSNSTNNQKPKDGVEETSPSSAEEKYVLAKTTYKDNPDDPDALIWYGRRAAYLGNYEEAIDIYTIGITKHPADARMYRHRGHRYISLRQFDNAIVDFEKAVALIDGQPDEVEPDGLPNARNTPIGTLQGNIWYHLGLAHYLKGDMENALKAFSNRTVLGRYDDNIVSGGHWLYMILRRMGRLDNANAAIAKVHPDMDIIENGSYYKMCLFYKGLLSEAELQPKEIGTPSDDVLAYGLGNYYLYHHQDTVKAKPYYERLMKDGNKNSFAYIAGEADWERGFGEE